MKYKCLICNKEFTDWKKNRKVCSRKCVAIYQSKSVKKSCDFCKKEILRRKSSFRGKNSFCNKKCQHQFEKISKTKFPQLRDKDWCLNQYKNFSMKGIADKIGCGETVVFKFFKIHNILRDRNKWLIGRVRSQSHKNNISLSKIGKSNGDKNPNWRGGITPFRARVRTLKEYLIWKKQVLEKNPKICVLCGSTNRLEVDHIKQFRFILADNNIKTIEDARNCKELWNVDNGRILCRYCNINQSVLSKIK